MQNVAMERVAHNKHGAKRKLTEEGVTDEKAIIRSAYKIATRPQEAAPEAADVLFYCALMHPEANWSLRKDVKMSHEVSLLNIEKISHFGTLLHLPRTSPEFKKINLRTDEADSL